MEPIAADEMVIEYVGQNIRQVWIPALKYDLSVCVEQMMSSLPDEDNVHLVASMSYLFWTCPNSGWLCILFAFLQ